MEMNTRRRPQVIEEASYGVYVWEMPNGQWVGDEDGNFLNIASMKNDKRRLDELASAARACGIEEGKPLFLAAHRQVTEEEFEEQKRRMSFGLIPDEHDIPALVEEMGQRDLKR